LRGRRSSLGIGIERLRGAQCVALLNDRIVTIKIGPGGKFTARGLSPGPVGSAGYGAVSLERWRGFAFRGCLAASSEEATERHERSVSPKSGIDRHLKAHRASVCLPSEGRVPREKVGFLILFLADDIPRLSDRWLDILLTCCGEIVSRPLLDSQGSVSVLSRFLCGGALASPLADQAT
jgi:hypothetical protein